MKPKLEIIMSTIRKKQELANVKTSRYYNLKLTLPTFQIGERVWLHEQAISKGEKLNHKIQPKFVGPSISYY